MSKTLSSRELPAFVSHGTSVPYVLETQAKFFMTTLLQSFMKTDIPCAAERQCKTDLEQSLRNQKAALEERISGTDGKWKAHWQAEHAAVTRCLFALSEGA
jgi:hypothetical protein